MRSERPTRNPQIWQLGLHTASAPPASTATNSHRFSGFKEVWRLKPHDFEDIKDLQTRLSMTEPVATSDRSDQLGPLYSDHPLNYPTRKGDGCAVLFRLAESFAAKPPWTCHWPYDRRQRLGTVVKKRGRGHAWADKRSMLIIFGSR